MYEWDPEKARKNREKHGVSFADVDAVFHDPYALTREDERFEEQRYVTIGIGPTDRLLVVVYVWRGDALRIKSARRATPDERRQDEKQL